MDKLITIVGLGPGDPGMLPLQVWEQLNSEMPVYVRTAIHPTVEWLEQKGIKITTMDHHYREADTFESVYRRIAEEVVNAARMGPLVYAVPGHPMVAEESVRLILTMAAREGLALAIPEPGLCTDNGAMIAAAGALLPVDTDPWPRNADADLKLGA